MTESSPPRSSRHRWLRRLLFLAVLVVTSAVGAVGALPWVLSSSWVRGLICERASQVLRRPIALESLGLTWSGAFHLQGLRVADAPEFSPAPLLALDRLDLQVEPWDLFRGRLSLDLEVEGLKLRLIRGADGRTNLAALLEVLGPAAPPAAEAPQPAPAETALPLAEASVRVRVSRVTLEAEDRGQGRRALIRDARLALDIPELGAPVTLEAEAGAALDGEELAPLSLRLRAEHWLAPDRTPDLKSLLAEAAARLPGADLDLQADLARSRANGRVQVDLGTLLDFIRPFAPPEVAGSRLGGALELQAEGGGRPGEPMAFALKLRGDGLTASGPLLQGRGAGPVAVSLEVRGRAEPSAGTVRVEHGEVRLQAGTRVVWNVRASGLNTPAAEFEGEVGPAKVDLGELLALAASFLPDGNHLGLEGATLGFDRLSAAGPVPTSGPPGGHHRVALHGLVLALDAFRAETGGAAAEGEGLTLGVERLEADLVDLFPARAALGARLRVDRLRVRGPQELALDGVELPVLRVSLEDLRRTGGQPGLAGRGSIEEALTVAAAQVPSGRVVRGLRQAARLALALGEGGKVQAELRDLRVSAAGVEVAQPDLAVALSGAGVAPAVDLRVGGADLAGPFLGPSPLAGEIPLRVEDASLSLGRVRARAGAAEANGRGLSVSLAALSAALRDGSPREVTLRASLGADDLEVAGPASARVVGFRLPDLELRAGGVARADQSLLGLAGTVTLRETLAADTLEVAPHARLDGVRQSLALDMELGHGPEVRVAAGELALGAATGRAQVPGRGEVSTPLRAAARWDAVRLSGPGELRADVEGLVVDAAAGEWLRAELTAAARDSGRESVVARGSATLDLPGALRALPTGLWAGKAAGAVRVGWAFEGRVPSDEELRLLREDRAALAAGQPLAFLREASASLALEGVAADVALDAGQRASVAGVSTPEPLALAVRRGGREVSAEGELALGWIEALPGLGALAEPLRARLSFRGERGAEGVLRLSQSLAVEPLSLAQGADITVAGLDRLLRRGLDTPPAQWLNLLSGEARATLRVGETPDLGLVTREVVLKGPLEAGVALSLARGEEVSGAVSLLAGGARVRLGDRLALEGLRADLALEKHYRLRSPPAGGAAAGGFLSETLVRPEAPVRSSPASLLGPVRFGGTSTLGFDSLQVSGGPVPVEITGLEAAFSLPGGLPSVDRFALGTLGGFLVGSLEVSRPAEGPGFVLGTRAAFTGLDAARLVPAAAPRPGEDTELSGRFSLQLPLATGLPAVLAGAEVEAELTHVGSRVLDRALYALDPSESNEAVVKQRRLVRLGGPRWVRVGVRHGNLSLVGEVEAAGIRVQLPRLERFNVAEVPGMDAFGVGLAGLGPVVQALEALSAQTLEIDDAGRIRFRQGGEP